MKWGPMSLLTSDSLECKYKSTSIKISTTIYHEIAQCCLPSSIPRYYIRVGTQIVFLAQYKLSIQWWHFWVYIMLILRSSLNLCMKVLLICNTAAIPKKNECLGCSTKICCLTYLPNRNAKTLYVTFLYSHFLRKWRTCLEILKEKPINKSICL